jgi:hypothetical protein
VVVVVACCELRILWMPDVPHITEFWFHQRWGIWMEHRKPALVLTSINLRPFGMDVIFFQITISSIVYAFFFYTHPRLCLNTIMSYDTTNVTSTVDKA